MLSNEEAADIFSQIARRQTSILVESVREAIDWGRVDG